VNNMSVLSQKRIAAQLMKCGVTRIKINSAKEVEEALTRTDVRDLIKKGVITKIQKKGTTKAYSKIIRAQKKKGRRKFDGSKKGKAGARTYYKGLWITKIRTLRVLLKELKDNKQIERKDYNSLYSKANGGIFRDKKHLLNYVKENEILKGKKPRKIKPKVEEKPKEVKPPVTKQETKSKDKSKKINQKKDKS